MKKNIIRITVLSIVIFFILLINNTVFASNEINKKSIEDGIYTIKSAVNEKFVLDVYDASKKDGANVELWTNHGANNQKFNVKHLGNGYYSITSVNSNKSIDVENNGKKPGTNVLQWQNNNQDNQKWIIKDAGNGYYNIISKSNGLCLDIPESKVFNGANVQVWVQNGGTNQKFKFEKQDEKSNTGNQPITAPAGSKTVENGIYTIKSTVNNSVLDVTGNSMNEGANIEVWYSNSNANQRFSVNYLNNGYYTINAVHSGKCLDVEGASAKDGTNVVQWSYNGGDNQKWVIKSIEDGYYNIISKCNGLYLTVVSGNVCVTKANNSNSQKFKFDKANVVPSINTTKYPGYKESIEKLIAAHPNWNFKFLYTGLKFNEAVYGEYSIHSANLVPTSSGSEWICSVCGTKSYDTGWYGASDKAIAYYMDPRNFLNESNIFQFLDVNQCNNASSVEGIQNNVNGTFLEKYANDIYTACKNKNVDPYYVISRLIQENGKAGSVTSKGMKDNNGVTYYNPFNIGASGNSTNEVLANALKKAKANGWDSMRKALEGGIVFLKNNWLENYQNTLYQNKFDIDSTNGTSLYSHQYMQNLSAAYTEALTLRSYYTKTGKMDANLTFIIPVYENMSSTVSARPSDKVNSEEYPMNVIVNTESSSLALRDGAGTNSNVIARLEKGTVLLSIKRGINSTWQYVVTKDGKVGYMSGEYLKQINDEKKCNYSAYVKTQSSGGVNVRTGPSTTAGFSRVGYLPDYTRITVIDDSTYKGNEGNNWVQWSRIILEDGRQAFVPSSYVYR